LRGYALNERETTDKSTTTDVWLNVGMCKISKNRWGIRRKKKKKN